MDAVVVSRADKGATPVPATPSAGELEATVVDGGATLRTRLLSGVLLLAISGLAYFSHSQFDGKFWGRGEPGYSQFDADRHLWVLWEAVPEQNEFLLHQAFLTLSILCGASGLLLLFGGSFASSILSALDLAREPRQEMRLLATMLQLTAIWHLSIGGFIFAASMEHPQNAAPRILWVVVVFGVMPGLLAPYCSRGKRWSLWITGIFFLLVFALYSVIHIYFLQKYIAEMIPVVTLVGMPIVYWIYAGFIAGAACWSLRPPHSTASAGLLLKI